jgi:ribonuclease HI
MVGVALYTDGSAKGNPGPGGYGAILQSGSHEKELSKGYRLTTNNRMELMAVVAGLEALKPPRCRVHVVSDSKYVVNAFNEGWMENWKRRRFAKVQNERCDQLAVKAAESPTDIDQGYEASQQLSL